MELYSQRSAEMVISTLSIEFTIFKILFLIIRLGFSMGGFDFRLSCSEVMFWLVVEFNHVQRICVSMY